MTEQGQDETNEVEAPSKKGKLIRVAVMVIGVLLIAGLSAGVTWFLTRDSGEAVNNTNTMGSSTSPSQQGMVEGAQAIYFSVEPEFVVNYSVDGRQRFLLVEISVMARDQLTIDAVSQHLPVIRNDLIQLLTQQDIDELRTEAGKEKLARDMTEAIQVTLTELIGRPGIERVLFRSLVIS